MSSREGERCASRVVADDGFWFGLGAFETIAVEEGKPVFLAEHLQLLQETLDALEIPADIARVKERIGHELAKPELRQGRHALKVGVSEHNVVFSRRDNTYGPAAYDQGFSLVVSDVRRSAASPVVGRKTLCYADCILEKRHAMRQGVDEPIFLGEGDVITEGATTNVFGVRDGNIITTPAAYGLRPGVMRSWVLGNEPLACERALTLEEALSCDELFVTNALMGIMPVRMLGERAYDNAPVAKALQERYVHFIEEL